MKPKYKRLFWIPAVGLILVLLFQNMSLVEFALLDIPEVDEGARREQAQELLGEYYRGSLAQKLEGHQLLNYLVFKKVEGSIPNQWKYQVPEITETLITSSQEHGFDPVFILAVIDTESSFNPRARGTSGEIGLMQILPKTGEWIARKYKLRWKGEKSLFDPVTNIRIGITYFAHLKSEFNSRAYHYLPAYNMGPGNVRKIDRKMGSVKPDGSPFKREYAMRVMKNYSLIYQQMASRQKELQKVDTNSEVAAQSP